MPTREIPRQEWKGFLERYSREHQEALATVEVLGAELGDQTEAREVPLVGLSLEEKGSEAGSLEILLGTRPDAHLTHSIASPEHLFVRTGEGGEEDLEIESADGTRTLFRIRAASLSGGQAGPGAR
jgi:hypothetical protein